MAETAPGPNDSPFWNPRMYAAPSSPDSSASSPKVWSARDQRGSVARSTCGCRATRMPTAVYSWRAMSPNRSTSAASRVAARPSASGHCENGPASIAAPGFSVNEWRGSVEIVTGMPRRVDAASSCSLLCQRAIAPAVGATPSRLKCVMPFSTTYSRFDGSPNTGSASASSPSSPMVIIVWKKSPAFSSTVIAASSSSTRSSTGRFASSQGRFSADASAEASVIVVSVTSLP